ncbi:DEAD/DEAH box helicase [Rubritalea sp.]|uniref:DEAD/DEAH box helicase n=1 Tax=Rubritalea sp. TaxID=2109375 RepID=UPI003EF7562B
MSNRALIQWLSACYREDRIRVGIRDFFGPVKYRRMSKGEEMLLNGVMPDAVLPPSYASDVSSYSEMHRRERELLYGALFVCGKTAEGVHRAPLLLFSAKIEEVGDSYFSLKIALRGARLNPVAVDALQGPKELNEALRDIAIGDGLSEAMVGEIRTVIEEYCPHVDCESLLQWPYLEMSKDVESAGKANEVKVLSAAGLANIERQVSTRGLVQELVDLAEVDDAKLSPALRRVLGGVVPVKREGKQSTHFIPASLSSQQEKVVRSARYQPLTVCHGPPGTGKSYTIAAIALDHVIRGESVLVTSRGDHAVNVLHKKIDKMLGSLHATVRAGRSEHLRNLKSLLSELMEGGDGFVVDGPVSMHVLYREVEKTVELIRDAERVLEKEFEKAIKRADTHLDPSPNLVDSLKKVWDNYSIKRRPLLSEMRYHYQELQQERERQLAYYLELKLKCQITKVLDEKHSREELKKLWAGVRKRKGKAQQEILSKVDYSIVLKALPVWLTSTEDMHRVLPVTPELFDVLIVDEASQCDLASILPALQRAKRVVIVGDTKQLRHVSFLSKHALVAAAKDYAISKERVEKYHYRKRSLMDLAIDLVNDQKQTSFLDEHFRSQYGIIAYSNRRFYGERLQIMRDRPWLNHRGGGVSLISKHVFGGKRDARGVNQPEIKAVLNALDAMLSKHRRGELPSIGVLSPFRAQVDALTQAVFTEFRGKKLHRLQREGKLLVGTAHSFQGEERSVMLISLVVDPDTNAASLRFLEREDVFNVAITRARDEQWVFHSVDYKDLKHDSMLADYLMHIEAGVSDDRVSSLERDAFAAEVLVELKLMGKKATLGGEVAGVVIDIVVHHPEQPMAIDLIGYPGDMQAAVHSKKAHMLSRAGLSLLPLGYFEWQKRREECLVLLQQYLPEYDAKVEGIEINAQQTSPVKRLKTLKLLSYVKKNNHRHYGMKPPSNK